LPIAWGWAKYTEPPLLAGKCHQTLKMTAIAAHPQETVFQTAALEIGLEFPVDMVGQ